MPWRDVGTAALAVAGGRDGALSKRGMKLNFSSVDELNSGGGFVINNLNLAGFAGFSCKSVSLRPQLLASLLSLAPVCEISFQGASAVVGVGGQAMSLGNGGLLLSVKRGEILCEKIHTDGELGVNGFITLDTSKMKIGRADAALKIPESFAGNMDVLKSVLPLQQVNNNWFLRRVAVSSAKK